MKALLLGFYGDDGKKIITELTSKVTFKTLDMLGNKVVINNADQLFLNKSKYRNGQLTYKELQDLKEVPIDVWEKMQPYEIEFYKQLDRLTRTHYVDSYKVRYEFYKKSLKYFNHLIDSRNYDFVLMSNVPHLMYDILIFGLCKAKNIPVHYFYRTPIIPDEFHYLYLSQSLQNHNLDLILNYQRQYHSGNHEDSLNQEIKKIHNTWSNITDKEKKTTTKKTDNINNLIESIKNFQPIEDINENLTWGGLGTTSFLPIKVKSDIREDHIRDCINLLRSVYQTLAVDADLNEKYIYFPLHMQPEATSQPLGGLFQDQSLAALLLAESIPDDHFLYIKEFPKQGFLHRNIEFYEELANHPKIKLIPLGFDTVTLMKNSVAVATLTGTVAWEAFYSKVPALIFGGSILEGANGVFKISKREDINSFFSKLNEGFKIKDIDIQSYTYALLKVSVKGYLEPYKKPVINSDFSKEDNTRNIVNFIISNVIKKPYHIVENKEHEILK